MADIALAGMVFAPHYARAEPRCCGLAATMMRLAPDLDAVAVSQLLPGEGFAVLDIAQGWAWGYSTHDHYVGYVRAEALAGPIAASHVVIAPLAPLFAAPDIKAAVKTSWSLGSRLAGEATGDFIACDAGYLHRRHVARIGTVESDPVTVAERLIGQPYLWGGRGAGGVDCSGLVQVALAACGIDAPRDSDLQREGLGSSLSSDAPLRRGDLLFFPGHVGLMVDEAHLLHANAHWMTTLIEPLADVVARLAASHPDPILARRRIGQ